jgi:hypothetical protein
MGNDPNANALTARFPQLRQVKTSEQGMFLGISSAKKWPIEMVLMHMHRDRFQKLSLHDSASDTARNNNDDSMMLREFCHRSRGANRPKRLD